VARAPQEDRLHHERVIDEILGDGKVEASACATAYGRDLGNAATASRPSATTEPRSSSSNQLDTMPPAIS